MAKSWTNAALAEALADLAQRRAAQGEDTYRVRAFHRAAATVANLRESVVEEIAAGADLTRHPGIGPKIAQTIRELVEKGSTSLSSADSGPRVRGGREPEPSGSRVPLKLLSFNIRHGGGSRIDRIAEVISGHNPDVLVLPEFRNNPAGEKLRKWLQEFGHRHQAVPPTEESKHNSVLLSARVPFQKLEFPSLAAEARRCVPVKIGSLTIFAFYFATMERKRPMFEFIKSLPKAFLKTESLLIGDLNTGCRYWDEGRMDLSLVEEFGAVLGCGWTDVWRQRNPGIREWSWVEPWGRHVGYRLDHALVSPPLLPRVRDVRYSHPERLAGVSDHSGLLLELGDSPSA